MKAILALLMFNLCSPLATASDWSRDVLASKPYFLEIRFAESAVELKTPSDLFLLNSRSAGAAFIANEAGHFKSSDADVIYQIRKSGDAFSAQLRFAVMQRLSETRIVLHVGEWTRIASEQHTLNDEAPRFFYVFARVSKND